MNTTSSEVVHKNPVGGMVRWSARILSLLSIGFFLMMFIGEGGQRNFVSIAAFQAFVRQTGLAFLFFPIGLMAGMIVAWWRAGIGGAITVASLALFYVNEIILTGRPPRGLFFMILALPGFLFLLARALSGPRPQ